MTCHFLEQFVNVISDDCVGSTEECVRTQRRNGLILCRVHHATKLNYCVITVGKNEVKDSGRLEIIACNE